MRKGTKKKGRKSAVLHARTTEKAANRIRMLAKLYAGGNVSKWLEHGGLEAPRKKLK